MIARIRYSQLLSDDTMEIAAFEGLVGIAAQMSSIPTQTPSHQPASESVIHEPENLDQATDANQTSLENTKRVKKSKMSKMNEPKVKKSKAKGPKTKKSKTKEPKAKGKKGKEKSRKRKGANEDEDTTTSQPMEHEIVEQIDQTTPGGSNKRSRAKESASNASKRRRTSNGHASTNLEQERPTTSVYLQISSPDTASSDGPRASSSPSPQSKPKVQELRNGDTSEEQDDVHDEIEIEAAAISYVIGGYHQTIRSMQISTGADIRVVQKGHGRAFVEIRGDNTQRQAALDKVKQTLYTWKNQPNILSKREYGLNFTPC